MATIKKIKKAQNGFKKEEMVESEMFPGKMIPKSKSTYHTGEYTKMLEDNRKSTLKSAAKKAPKTQVSAKKPAMKTGGKLAKTSKEKQFAALAAPKNKITFADKLAGAKKKK